MLFLAEHLFMFLPDTKAVGGLENPREEDTGTGWAAPICDHKLQGLAGGQPHVRAAAVPTVASLRSWGSQDPR